MLKLTGSILILTACTGYAGSLLGRKKFHRDILLSLVRILNLLAGEIRYERLTMVEAMEGLTEKYEGAVGDVMRQIAERLKEVSCEDLETVWNSYFREAQSELLLTAEELDIVLETGKNLGYLDAAAQVGHLHRCRERLEHKLSEAEKEMAEKRKLYGYLAVAAGVMVILVLI